MPVWTSTASVTVVLLLLNEICWLFYIILNYEDLHIDMSVLHITKLNRGVPAYELRLGHYSDVPSIVSVWKSSVSESRYGFDRLRFMACSTRCTHVQWLDDLHPSFHVFLVFSALFPFLINSRALLREHVAAPHFHSSIPLKPHSPAPPLYLYAEYS